VVLVGACSISCLLEVQYAIRQNVFSLFLYIIWFFLLCCGFSTRILIRSQIVCFCGMALHYYEVLGFDFRVWGRQSFLRSFLALPHFLHVKQGINAIHIYHYQLLLHKLFSYRGVFGQNRLLGDSGRSLLHVTALGATTRLNSALYLTYCTLHRIKDMMNYISERPVCTMLAPRRSVYFLCLLCFFVAHCVKQQPSHYCAADRSHQYSRSGSATTMAAGHCPSVSI
jgi:hypothetical protein